MGESSAKINVEELISYSDDLVKVLKDRKDTNNLTECLHQWKALQSQCDSDSQEVQRLLGEYQEKIDGCRKKTEQARCEVAAGAELESLQKELKEELERERALEEELRNQVNELERQRISIEERRQSLRQLEKEELREQSKLSMYACVTKIIPNLQDHSRISGCVVERNKKVVEKFEYDPSKTTAFEVCDSIWKMINS